MRALVTVLILTCETITGCAGKSAVSNINDVNIIEISTNDPDTNNETDVETESEDQTESLSKNEDTLPKTKIRNGCGILWKRCH